MTVADLVEAVTQITDADPDAVTRLLLGKFRQTRAQWGGRLCLLLRAYMEIVQPPHPFNTHPGPPHPFWVPPGQPHPPVIPPVPSQPVETHPEVPRPRNPPAAPPQAYNIPVRIMDVWRCRLVRCPSYGQVCWFSGANVPEHHCLVSTHILDRWAAEVVAGLALPERPHGDLIELMAAVRRERAWVWFGRSSVISFCDWLDTQPSWQGYHREIEAIKSKLEESAVDLADARRMGIQEWTGHYGLKRGRFEPFHQMLAAYRTLQLGPGPANPSR